MLTGPHIILTLKIAVLGVTVLLLASLLALSRGNYKLHGQINRAFFLLTIAALLGLELVVRLLDPAVFDYFDADTKAMLATHLCFAVPSAMLLPIMLFTGLRHRRRWHLTVAAAFTVLWAGTFVTGIFFLPHASP